MFKIGSFEEEIRQDMESKLALNQSAPVHRINKFAKALDLLNAAASVFDEAEMYEESSEITEWLSSLTSKYQK